LGSSYSAILWHAPESDAHIEKPDFYFREQLSQRIQADPTSSVDKLLVGTPNLDCVRAIHESLGSKSRLAYFRRNILQDIGVTLPGWIETPFWCFDNSEMIILQDLENHF
jgi:hypothetical protein